jgi:hypothetical protein
MTLYSAFKNAIAPSAMYLAMVDIFSLPASCFETHADLMAVYIRAMIPKKGTM